MSLKQTIEHPALYHFQPSNENTSCHLQITTYAIYNLKIIIYAIHLSIYQCKTFISFPSSKIEQFWEGGGCSWTKGLQSFPIDFHGSLSLSSSSSILQNHLLLSCPTSLFCINFNYNTLLSIQPTYDDTSPRWCNG
jgi:hypothetical protein